MLPKKFKVLTSSFEIHDKRVECYKPPCRPLKITGTRFSAVLGLDQFKTPFEVWCELVRITKCEFVETPQIKAGKIIEKKLVNALKENLPKLNIKTASECPELTDSPYDYFPNNTILGGKWDAIGNNTMIELKTTAAKNARYWARGVPKQHMLQTALYAYLAHCERFIIACSFLPDIAYENPESFKPELGKYIGNANSYYREFCLKEVFPDFDEYLYRAQQYWKDYVLPGISPEYTMQDSQSGLVHVLWQTNQKTNQLQSYEYHKYNNLRVPKSS